MAREILIGRQVILARVEELAREISADYAGKEPILIGILNGVIFFFADLVMRMTIPCKIDFIRVASYGSGTTSSGAVKFIKNVEIPVQGQDVLIVEDIVDTGLTLDKIVKSLKEKNAASTRICALIDKKERREQPVTIDYRGFEVEEGFLVGYGLDYDEHYRNLRDIHVLK
ncbi:MAG: hypoxanthine phosphoribosyltransferase [Deltaproteobacteria bacterium]